MKDEDEYHVGDIHGQRIMNYRHPHLSDEQTAEYMIRAFDADFAANGPSTVRIARTTLAGWKRHKDHPDPRIRRRFRWEGRELGNAFTALVAASRKYFADPPPRPSRQDVFPARGTVSGVRLEIPRVRFPGGTLAAEPHPPGRKQSSGRMDLRTADFLRTQRRGDGQFGSPVVPMHATGRDARGRKLALMASTVSTTRPF